MIDGTRIGLLGLNLALMSGRMIKATTNDFGNLVVGTPQVIEGYQQIVQDDIHIAVMHHPFEWLAEFDRRSVENRLNREFHFILCGHEHEPNIKPNISVERGKVGDYVIIPAGASYETRVAGNPRYTNSYNFVHFDFETRQGTIYLRRWSDRSIKWVEDKIHIKGEWFNFAYQISLPKLSSAPTTLPSPTVPQECSRKYF